MRGRHDTRWACAMTSSATCRTTSARSAEAEAPARRRRHGPASLTPDAVATPGIPAAIDRGVPAAGVPGPGLAPCASSRLSPMVLQVCCGMSCHRVALRRRPVVRRRVRLVDRVGRVDREVDRAGRRGEVAGEPCHGRATNESKIGGDSAGDERPLLRAGPRERRPPPLFTIETRLARGLHALAGARGEHVHAAELRLGEGALDRLGPDVVGQREERPVHRQEPPSLAAAGSPAPRVRGPCASRARPGRTCPTSIMARSNGPSLRSDRAQVRKEAAVARVEDPVRAARQRVKPAHSVWSRSATKRPDACRAGVQVRVTPCTVVDCHQSSSTMRASATPQ